MRIIEVAKVYVRPSEPKTRHIRSGIDVSAEIETLKIAQFEGDPGFYLLYLDRNARELNDTYHESRALAREQAQFEFGVKDEDWQLAEAQ